jgi:tousled-like kinase
MLKEISNLKRENKRKWLNEQQYYLGKISTTFNYNNNKAFECWEDGRDIIEINKKLKKIITQKDELLKQKDKNEENIKNPKNSIISFKLNILEREEKELNNKLENIEKKKLIYLQELNLLNQEMNCTFAPHKKEGLPLLNERYQIISLLGKGGYSEVYKA